MYIHISQIAEVRTFMLTRFEDATHTGSKEVMKRLLDGMDAIPMNDTKEAFYECWGGHVIVIFRTTSKGGNDKWYILHPRDNAKMIDIPAEAIVQSKWASDWQKKRKTQDDE